ncbi:ATPase [Sulfitobacter sp. M57]|uniref:ATP12 family chaperone protein n=1 Tax=unclassified Sulfitobacter TaxID=196795 RepID=UPI0023E0B0F9|nr:MULTISPECIES: ATP12 family protein [unclassified Sulfitobacter]MDF3414451.1 ATPase [Sulfitobacter sp. KE5]MDF3421932.1 ATPase [Sulfitobacter sp. KE43]MDF3432997.1 ATPase [Sulfitobacter sp. KE42]MDF3458637.1 ATPase [Sulfitobacter sp. S74]MDF3462537.1 ATPase [Sulfitobacter sp. Ks18]
MSDWKAKRFWKEATVQEANDGFEVRLDGRPVKTPAKRGLILPTRAMAEVIAAEWDAQEGEINPHLMPATKTANAAIDKVAIQHGEVADMLADYGDSDLLCYRADGPSELVVRQASLWDPMLEWARCTLGVTLAPRTGVIHVPQEESAIAVLRSKTHALSFFELAAFHDLVSLSGSLVLGFAAAHHARDAETLWDLSRLDEIWQAEQWGLDEEAEAMAAVKKDSFLHANTMFTLCRTD